MTEEGITGAFIRDLKGNTRTVCFVTGSGEHQIDNTDRDGLSQFSDLLGKEEYQDRGGQLASEGAGPGRLHHARCRRTDARLPAARGGCDQDVC